MSPIRVLIADDHPAVRDGLGRMLERDSEIQVVSRVASGEEAITQTERLCPDIVLMDVKMPRMGGIAAIHKLKEKKPALNIIVLTAYDDEQYITAAVEAGAIGYLLKDIDSKSLCRAIRQAYEGHSPFDASIIRPILTHLADMSRNKTVQKPDLSERQLKILHLIAAGATSKEIAAQLFVSYATVKREMNRIFIMLNVSNRAEAVAEAYERKLL
ncbi:response regulator [Chloroflexota bacterium]